MSEPRMMGPPGRDPRDWQIAFLLTFLGYVLAFRDFAMPWAAMAVVFATGLGLQVLLARLSGAPDSGVKSAIISCASICLLLRVNLIWVAALAAALAIASKFVLRVRGKHFFNPTNFGILATVLLTGAAWVSPAQWGSAVILAFFLAALGLLVTRRCGRLDISLAFLVAHVGLNLGRTLWLGERLEVLGHRMASGALIVFAFFMISDPRSTPDSRAGRIAFAALVAAVTYHLQFHLFWPSAPLWALLMVSPTTPVLDALFGGERFEWLSKGGSDAHPPHPAPVTAGRRPR